MVVPSEIETPRLMLRPVSAEDWRLLLASVTHPEFPDRLTLATFDTPRLARAWVNFCVDCWSTKKRFVWTVVEQTSAQGIGQISLTHSNGSWALSYWLSPDYWRQGYASEGCNAVLKTLHTWHPASTLVAGAARWNMGSQQVLRKLGFERVGNKQMKLMNGRVEDIIEFECALP